MTRHTIFTHHPNRQQRDQQIRRMPLVAPDGRRWEPLWTWSALGVLLALVAVLSL